MGGDGGFQFNPAYADEVIILDECVGNVIVIGPLWEQVFARVLQWFTVILSAAFLVYYVYSTFKATCGWEELYVCSVECKSGLEASLHAACRSNTHFSAPPCLPHACPGYFRAFLSEM